MSETRPPITAGPIERAFKFLKSTSVSCGEVGEGVGVAEDDRAAVGAVEAVGKTAVSGERVVCGSSCAGKTDTDQIQMSEAQKNPNRVIIGSTTLAKAGIFAMSEMRVSCRFYDAASFGTKSRRCVRRGKQTQYRVGDRESMGGRGCALDFQLSRRTTEGKRRGISRRVWREHSVVSLRCFQRQ